ncbi:MAG: alpha-ribazole phosphatase family protein [Sterolibacterium sp.]|nr:alpha-ribazole phosphatase family protein [Sterolibacterium sp.]
MQLFLIRHPPPDVMPGLCYGRSDLALAGDAASVAASLRSLLPKNVPVFSSPLTRCCLLAEALHPAPQFDARLLELDFGDWEMRPWAGIDRTELDRWAADPHMFTPPSGESVGAMRSRVADFLGNLVGQSLGSAILVTHAGVMKLCAAELLGLAPAKWLSMQFEFGTVSLIDDAKGTHELIWHNRTASRSTS